MSQPEVDYPDVPDWEGEFFDRVSDRLMFNYDLEKDYVTRGESFDLYGEMRIESQKHLFTRHLKYAEHGSTEHLFARRQPSVTVDDLERLVDLGHALFEEWVTPSEEHYSTDFTFAVVALHLSEDVRSFVSGFKDRTLLRYGFNGHYEINLLVATPEAEDVVASASADVGQAFAVWESIERKQPGLLDLIIRRLQV